MYLSNAKFQRPSVRHQTGGQTDCNDSWGPHKNVKYVFSETVHKVQWRIPAMHNTSQTRVLCFTLDYTCTWALTRRYETTAISWRHTVIFSSLNYCLGWLLAISYRLPVIEEDVGMPNGRDRNHYFRQSAVITSVPRQFVIMPCLHTHETRQYWHYTTCIHRSLLTVISQRCLFRIKIRI